MLRYSKLTDEQVLKRLMQVVDAEGAPHNDSGIEALIFTAEGDMRQALNNAQATHAGFGLISSENVFRVRDAAPPPLCRPPGCVVVWPSSDGPPCTTCHPQVCDQPHPLLIKKALHACMEADFQAANSIVEGLWAHGYCGLDMVGTLFRIVKFEPMDEGLKLEFVKARRTAHHQPRRACTRAPLLVPRGPSQQCGSFRRRSASATCACSMDLTRCCSSPASSRSCASPRRKAVPARLKSEPTVRGRAASMRAALLGKEGNNMRFERSCC